MWKETTGNSDPPQMEMCASVALSFRKQEGFTHSSTDIPWATTVCPALS